MAVADPCVCKGLNEWKKDTEEKRRESGWAKFEASEEEEEEEGEEEDEDEAGWKGEEEAGEHKEGQKTVRREAEVDEEEMEERDVEEDEEEEEGEEECEFKGEREVTEEVRETEEGYEERKMMEVMEVEEEEEEEEEEAGGNDEELKNEERREVDVKEERDEKEETEEVNEETMQEEMEVEEMEEEATDSGIVGNLGGMEVWGNERVVESEGGLVEAEQEEEGETEEEVEMKVKREMKEGEDDGGETTEKSEDDNEGDEQSDEEQDSDYDHEDSGRMQCEDGSLDSEMLNDEENTAEDKREDFEEAEDSDGNSRSNEHSVSGAWASEERNKEEDASKKLVDEEETVAGSWTSQTEDIQDYEENLTEEEEEDAQDEEDDCFLSEDVDHNNENMKIYHQHDYAPNLFHMLTEFRDSSLLTDLLITQDGKSFQVHSPVLAAVSSLIWEALSRRSKGNDGDDESIGINSWSMSLGPEVDRNGLEAIVEFAYTGFRPHRNQDTAGQIKSVAQVLGVPRVMDLCTEEMSPGSGEQKDDKKISAAAEQMAISLKVIRRMWMDQVGCDVTLEGVGKSLQVHRVVLAASSDYFRGMFTSGMKESHQPRVTLPFILASELDALISCSYTGTLPLSWNSVFELTGTALQLQYQPALSLCLSFMQEEINPQSCLDVASFAEAYELVHLLEIADDFVLRQFERVACTSKFKDLPAKQLLKYLNSRSLCVPSELVVFRAVVAWIQAKPRIRCKLAKVLMTTVHFPLMTFKEFKEVRSLSMWSDHGLDELYEAIFQDFCCGEITPQSQCRVYLPKESLVLIGGDQISDDLGSRSISRDLWFGNSLRNHTGMKRAMEWRRLGEMPETARFGHEVAALKGQLYVFGGKKYYGINDTLDSVYRYDPHQNSWVSLAEMQEKRCYFSVVVLDGKIYAIGGHCDPEYRDSVERYCPKTNSWSYTRPLDLPLSGHVAKVLQGQIFVSGGLNGDYRCLASMFRYHPETGSTYLANMTQPRAHHCMETLGDHLYVAGGLTTDKDNSIVDQLCCEVYSPDADSWTAFAALPVAHVGAGSAVLEGKFYVLGGYSQEDYTDTTTVHRYNVTTQRWENMGKMPGPNNDLRASLLCLPSHFRL